MIKYVYSVDILYLKCNLNEQKFIDMSSVLFYTSFKWLKSVSTVNFLNIWLILKEMLHIIKSEL